MNTTRNRIITITLLICGTVSAFAAPDAARVAGDLRVDGIVFNLDGNRVQTKASPWGYGAGNGVDIGIQYKVGIGKLIPDFTLDVAGDAQFSGNLLLPATTATTGIIRSGMDTLFHTFGLDNLFIGRNAGNLTTTGSQNTAIGVDSLRSLTNGIENTAIGTYSLRSNSAGFYNTATGNNALFTNYSGAYNTATGHYSLAGNTKGSYNTAYGASALQENSTGDQNTAVGSHSLFKNSIGSFNTAIGYGSGGIFPPNVNTTGTGNTFIGANSGSGTPNQLTNATAIGFNALVSQSDSLVLGAPGVKVGIGTSVPTSALDVVGTVKASLFAGDGTSLAGIALSNHNHDNSYWKMNGNVLTVPGTNFIGTIDNKAFEIKVNNQRAMRIEPNSGSPNIVSGNASNSSGAVGNFGATIAGGGSASGPNSATSTFSTVSGGWGNTASAASSTVGGGEFNEASGTSSFISGGSNNKASGNFSWAGGRQAKTVGQFTGSNHHGAFVWSDSAANAAVSGQDFYSMANDEFAVRARGGVRFVTAVNATTGAPTKTTTIDSSGNLVSQGSITATGYITNTSDLRLKTDIAPLEDSLAKLLRLRGVSYVMKADETKERKIGVIAQELEQEYPELVLTDSQGVKSVAYANLSAVLIEAVKGQQQTINSLKSENETLKARLEKIEQLLLTR